MADSSITLGQLLSDVRAATCVSKPLCVSLALLPAAVYALGAILVAWWW